MSCIAVAHPDEEALPLAGFLLRVSRQSVSRSIPTMKNVSRLCRDRCAAAQAGNPALIAVNSAGDAWVRTHR